MAHSHSAGVREGGREGGRGENGVRKNSRWVGRGKREEA
jgi:hypothetical protein